MKIPYPEVLVDYEVTSGEEAIVDQEATLGVADQETTFEE